MAEPVLPPPIEADPTALVQPPANTRQNQQCLFRTVRLFCSSPEIEARSKAEPEAMVPIVGAFIYCFSCS